VQATELLYGGEVLWVLKVSSPIVWMVSGGHSRVKVGFSTPGSRQLVRFKL
jgi:hypothetical protein